MPTLFDPIKIGDLELANRIVMAPLTRNRSPRAVPNDLTVTYYAQRATAGLIITEATSITHQGQGYADVPGLYEPEQLDAWKKVTDAVHARGGKIVVQMWHVGRISHTALQPDGGAPVAPSAIKSNSRTYLVYPDGTGQFVETSQPRALALAELPGIVEDYRRAASASMAAGFDGVEIHAANGYLIDQFLRSGSNHRIDAYGGSIENRARFLLEVVDAVTKEIGAGRVGIRISPVTPVNDASDPEPQALFAYVAEKLAAYKLAYIHIIEGATDGPRDFQQGDKPFDYPMLRATYEAAGGSAAWMVNNGYDRELGLSAVANGDADLIAYGKLFIANPDLVRRLRENAGFNEADRETFFGAHGAQGFTDYPEMGSGSISEAAKAVVRRNTEEVQSRGNFDVFEELFGLDFVDHTPQPDCTPDRDGARGLYQTLRNAFPDFHAKIHWQIADGELVTTYKTYHGTHGGLFLGMEPTGRKIHFESVDVMRVHEGKITEHWGVGNLYSLMRQLSAPMDAGTASSAT